MSDAVVAIGSAVNDEVRTATLDVLNGEAQCVFLQDQPPVARAETLRDATILIVTRVGRDVSPAKRDVTAGLDVWWHEPTRGMDFRPDHPFLELPNVIGSPHDSAIVAGSHAVAAQHAAENVRRYLRGEPAAGVVRREDYLEP
jgi:hypothetical protein